MCAVLEVWAEGREKRFVSGTRHNCRDGFLCSETGKLKTQDHWASYAECLGRVSNCLGCRGGGMWKLTVMVQRVIYKMTTRLQFLSMCCCDSVARASAGAFGMAARQTVVVTTIGPLVHGVVWCVRRKKIPEKQGAGLPLASSSTLRSCSRPARAFLTRRNHLSEPTRWADLNLRFSLIPMSMPPTPALATSKLLPFSPTGSRPEIASPSRRTLISFYSSPRLISRAV
jgi:hypothetical protein